jgi:hypothetical protein
MKRIQVKIIRRAISGFLRWSRVVRVSFEMPQESQVQDYLLNFITQNMRLRSGTLTVLCLYLADEEKRPKFSTSIDIWYNKEKHEFLVEYWHVNLKAWRSYSWQLYETTTGGDH